MFPLMMMMSVIGAGAAVVSFLVARAGCLEVVENLSLPLPHALLLQVIDHPSLAVSLTTVTTATLLEEPSLMTSSAAMDLTYVNSSLTQSQVIMSVKLSSQSYAFNEPNLSPSSAAMEPSMKPSLTQSQVIMSVQYSS